MTDAKSERERHYAAWEAYYAQHPEISEFDRSVNMDGLENLSLWGLRHRSAFMGFNVHV